MYALSQAWHFNCRSWRSTEDVLVVVNPLTPTVVMGTAIKHPVPDRVNPSFVIFDTLTLWRSALSARVP